MSRMQSTVIDTGEVTRSGVEANRAMVAQLDRQGEQLTSLSQRISQLESGLRDVAALKREVATLIEIERDNLTELFEAQLALQQAQMTSDVVSVEETQIPEKTYPEGAIVFPLPVGTQ